MHEKYKDNKKKGTHTFTLNITKSCLCKKITKNRMTSKKWKKKGRPDILNSNFLLLFYFFCMDCSIKRKFACFNPNYTIEEYQLMGSKQSTTAHHNTTTKRKRSNTQASHHNHLETITKQDPNLHVNKPIM